MKVRELVAMLAKADPDDIVAKYADAKCLLLLNQRQGIPPCFACAALASWLLAAS